MRTYLTAVLPEVSIRGAGQEDRSLWGRECGWMQPTYMRSVSFWGKFTSGSRISASRSDLLKVPFVERLPHSAPAHANYSEVFLQSERKIAASVKFKDIEISGPCLKHCLKNSFSKHFNKIDEKVVLALRIPINIFPSRFC